MKAAWLPPERSGTDACGSGPLLENLKRRLADTGYRELRHLQLTFHEGLAVLHGRVGSYHLKQLAQSVLLPHPDVRLLSNLIEVVAEDRPEDSDGGM